ncbi:MAG: thiolase domain-containing protein [Acidobacteriota bacterium]|nr:thiolase domain-containing protein [Acidobacteriota bacterium]
MRPVAIVGAGKTPFGAFADLDLRSLAVTAGQKALKNAGLDAKSIDAFYLGNFAGPEFTGQNHLAPYISTALGMTGIPSTRFEAACASGGAAFFHAYMGVASGIYDIVMAAGVEKMTCQPTSRVTEILAGAGDCATEVKAGSTFPSLFAMIARRHMHEFGTTRAHLSAVAVKNHENGALNPDAQMRKIITLDQAMNARAIAEPLNLYDCSLISDGAAAVVLCAADRAAEFSRKPVKILGVAQASEHVALDEKPDITSFAAVQGAARKAYAMAGLGPHDIQFAELHDCFTIAEIVAMEDLGFVGRGRGGFFTAEGATRRDGAMPINASGGLKSKGHPVGATGVAQICDVVQQIRCEAGERQLKRRSLGLAQNLGGSGGTCVVTILGE